MNNSKIYRFLISPTTRAVLRDPNRSDKVILNLFKDLIINGLRFRNEFGMTLSMTFYSAQVPTDLLGWGMFTVPISNKLFQRI